MVYRRLKKVINFLFVSPSLHMYLAHRYRHWWAHNPFSPNSYYYRGLYDNLNKYKNVHKKILGVWDFNQQTGTLGDAITFQEVLNCLRCMHRLASGEDHNIDICYIDDNKHPNVENPRYMKTHEWKQLIKSTHLGNPYVSSVYEFSTNTDFNQFFTRYKDEYLTWPGDNVAYDIRIIHHFFEENKFIPKLSCHPETINWALDFVDNHVSPSILIVVQIRKNVRNPERNTNIEALYDFFRSYKSNDFYKFIIVCHQDEIDETLEKLDNVIFVKRHNATLEKELALIQIAYAGIFPQSGMYPFAAFTGVPYLMFNYYVRSSQPVQVINEKNPYFNYNSKYQRIFFEKENFHLLKTEFERLMSDLKKAGWQNPEQRRPVSEAQSTF